jgi:thymidylate synthase (FAD)
MIKPEVKVVSYTCPTSDMELDNMSDLISYCARVSNPSNQNNVETSEKLLRYCMKNSHWSIFEMANVCCEITTTRDIARQILRHRSFTFQEFSQRYADPTKELDFILREARLQDKKNRQNSIDANDNKDLIARWDQKQFELIEKARETYSWAIDQGIAKEQARSVLPEGNTVSRLYMNGTVRSWMHYIDLRTGNGTQKEHREIAEMCKEVIKPLIPILFED